MQLFALGAVSYLATLIVVLGLFALPLCKAAKMGDEQLRRSRRPRQRKLPQPRVGERSTPDRTLTLVP